MLYNLFVRITHTWTHFVLFYRYLLCVVIRCDHVEHQSTQPKREGQTNRSEIHCNEQRHQRWRRSAGGATQGRRSLLFLNRTTQTKYPAFMYAHIPTCQHLYLSVSAEPVRQHQERTLQDPWGWWERPHTHLLQPRQRRMAAKTRYVRPRGVKLTFNLMYSVWSVHSGVSHCELEGPLMDRICNSTLKHEEDKTLNYFLCNILCWHFSCLFVFHGFWLQEVCTHLSLLSLMLCFWAASLLLVPPSPFYSHWLCALTFTWHIWFRIKNVFISLHAICSSAPMWKQ